MLEMKSRSGTSTSYVAPAFSGTIQGSVFPEYVAYFGFTYTYSSVAPVAIRITATVSALRTCGCGLPGVNPSINAISRSAGFVTVTLRTGVGVVLHTTPIVGSPALEADGTCAASSDAVAAPNPTISAAILDPNANVCLLR